MPSNNLVIVNGHMGSDPQAVSGGKYARFSVATSKRGKKGEEKTEVTTWWNIFVPSEVTSKFILGNLRKGALVQVVGEASLETYEGKARLAVTASQVNRLGKAEPKEAEPSELAGAVPF